MDSILLKKTELLNRIDVVLAKIALIKNSNWFEDRNRISLILSNLASSLNNCDEKLLLKPMLDNISVNLKQIESNVNSKHYNLVDNYLNEIIKTIAFLNNANGKHNLQGYQSAVNKNIKLLETDIQDSLEKLNRIKFEIDENLDIFEKSQNTVSETIAKRQKEYEEKLILYMKRIDELSAETISKQDNIQAEMEENQQKFKTEYTNELIELKKELADVKIFFQKESQDALGNFDVESSEKIKKLSNTIKLFIDSTDTRIKELEASATEQIGFVAAATHSNIYKAYSDRARIENILWYIATVLSMGALVGLSIWWFVFTQYENTEFISLIARVCATVGVAVISRYCALQASKAKVVETKLRKIQLQMATFDAFVGSLEKADQDELKIKLTNKLIDQKDWLVHDKNEINIIKDLERLLGKIQHTYKPIETLEQEVDFHKVER